MRIDARRRDLGGLEVRRVLPSARCRRVGPFVFFDHMGPLRLAPGQGFDLPPHPHIALATLTFLFEGEIVHRDSTGATQPIRPGDVNWMVAGSGIAHSERSSDEARRAGAFMHGIQTWVALPQNDEECEPSFEHHPAATLPTIVRPGLRLDVIAGEAYGARSPVGVRSPTLYVHATLEAGAALELDSRYPERAVYVVEGGVSLQGGTLQAGAMLVVDSEVQAPLRSDEGCRLMLIGGEPLESERHIWWNFVSSSRDRIERAKEDWKEGRFPKVPGDDEFIPLPE